MQPPALGTLTWLPTSEHPELLALPVQQALHDLPVNCYVTAIDPNLADTAAFCGAYEVKLEESANCVIVAGRRGERSLLAAILVLANARADVNKTVRKRLDLREISFASMETAVAETEMEYGGITPIGLPTGWPILVDEDVAASDWVVVGSGIRGSKIAIHGGDTARLPGAEVLDLKKR